MQPVTCQFTWGCLLLHGYLPTRRIEQAKRACRHSCRCNGNGTSEPSPPLLRRKLPGRAPRRRGRRIDRTRSVNTGRLPRAINGIHTIYCVLLSTGTARTDGRPAAHVLPPRPLPAPASPDGTTTATTAPRNRTDGDVRPPLPPPLLESLDPRMCSSRSRA